MTDYPDGSEFGGVSGLIQPEPHELKAHEEMWIQQATASDTIDDSPEKAKLRLQKGGEFDYGTQG